MSCHLRGRSKNDVPSCLKPARHLLIPLMKRERDISHSKQMPKTISVISSQLWWIHLWDDIGSNKKARVDRRSQYPCVNLHTYRPVRRISTVNFLPYLADAKKEVHLRREYLGDSPGNCLGISQVAPHTALRNPW